MRSRFVPLLAILGALLSFTTVHAATEYLVVTTNELEPAFQALVAQKAARGYVTEIVTLEDLASAAVPGRDVPEQIRNYIQTVYAEGSLEFVVLGGDTGQIPTRYASSEYYPFPDSEIPTDLYFAALDGNWDADGDDLFGEVGVDAADLTPEIAVGRVPVRTPFEASDYLTKLSQYQDPVNDEHLNSALFLDEVLFPSSWNSGDVITLDGAEYGEQLRAVVQGGPRAMVDARLYENHLAYPGALLLTQPQSLVALGSGSHGLVLHTAWGNETGLSMGDGPLNSADALGLTNGPHYFVIMSATSQAAAPGTDTVLKDLLRNPNGGAVASIGLSRNSFPITMQQYLLDLNEQLFIAETPSLGEALKAVQISREAEVQDDNVWRYTQLALSLMGDPEVAVVGSVVGSSSPRAVSTRLQLRSIVPNPFNPQVTVHFDVLGDQGTQRLVSVSVFDLAGRSVRRLWNGPLDMGPHEQVWDGRNDAGVALSSGVYFVAIESGGERQSAKMALVK